MEEFEGEPGYKAELEAVRRLGVQRKRNQIHGLLLPRRYYAY